MLLNYADVMDRFKNKMGIKSDADVCRLFGISTAALSDRKRRGAIPFESIIENCIKNGVSTDYIFTGKSDEMTGQILYECDMSKVDHDKMIAIPYIDTLADIQHIIPNESHMTDLAPNMIVMSRSEHELINKLENKLYAVHINDASMDDTIINGALMLVDFTDKGSQSGRIYVVDVNGEILVRRLFKDPSIGNMTMMSSDNKNFPEQKVDNENFEVWGRVVLSYNKPKIM